MKESLKLHKKVKGKLEIRSKVNLKNKIDLSLAYTPGVAEVCTAIAQDKSKVYDYTIKQNTVAIVTDGSAVLGLGNIGPEAALPVMEGKAILFKEFADVDAFPICLKTQDTEEIISIIKNISPVFGGINLEDISAPRCFEIETRLKKELDIPVFHDDQHGTAIVVLAGLINSLKLANKNKSEVKIIVNGAGAAGIAITKLLLFYGIKNIIVCDSKGAIFEGRKENMNSVKKEISKLTNKNNIKGKLEDVIKKVDVFIGISTANVLSKQMIKSMNNKPIIFAMANPNPEIMPKDAEDAGAFIVATGRSDFSNQINNVLAFPGIFRGLLDSRSKDITEEIKVIVAEAIANFVTKIYVDKIVPNVLERNLAQQVAKVIINYKKENK